MPVHHEKPEKIDGPRGSSRNRNVQREASIDRRPVITQEKPLPRPSKKSEKEKVPARTKVPSTSREPAVKKLAKSDAASISSALTEKAGKIIRKAGSSSKEATKVQSDKNAPAKVILDKKERVKISSVKKPSISDKVALDKIAIEKTAPDIKLAARANPRKPGKEVKSTMKSPTDSSNKAKKPIKAVSIVKKTKPKEEIVSSGKKISSDDPSTRTKQSTERAHYRTKTRTLSPSEVKVLSNSMDVMNPLEQKVELEDEAEDLASGWNEKNDEKSEDSGKHVDLEEDNDDYDDDFEDYESDFEEDTQESASESDDRDSGEEKSENILVPSILMDTPQENSNINQDRLTSSHSARRRVLQPQELPKDQDSERKLDSGIFDFPSSHQKREFDEVILAIKEENSKKMMSEARDADEGFVEEKENTVMKDINSEFLNFSGAGKRENRRESVQKQRQRGEILSRMITLDAITYTLMEIAPVPYDDFMKTYGRCDTSQAQVQTNEDDCEEEAQTEEINLRTKWTQAPAEFTRKTDKDGIVYFEFSNEERLGVGGDSEEDTRNEVVLSTETTVNTANLNNFLKLAGRRVKVCLEAHSQRQSLSVGNKQLSSELSCCDGKTTMEREENTQDGAAIAVVCAPGNSNLILSVHKKNNGGSILYIWAINEPSSPLKVLLCRKEIQCATFDAARGSVIFGGAIDGSLNVWDLREGAELHPEAEDSRPSRSPTYSTAEVLKEEGHVGSVVSIQVLSKDLDDVHADFTPLQICTMDESGMVIVWSVVQLSGTLFKVPDPDLGMAPWGRIRLVKASSFLTAKMLSKEETTLAGSFGVLQILKPENNEILIGSSSGEVIHCSTKGVLQKPKYYKPGKNSRPSGVMSLAVFPLDSRYFLVGCSDGTIRLHKCEQEQPIISLHWNLGDTTPASSIKALQWLHSKPCMFFCLDATTRIHIWNLAVSDIYPQQTIAAFINPVTCFAMIRPKRLGQHGFMVLGRGDGQIEVHRRKEEFRSKSKEEYKKERKMLQKYVTIL